MRKHNERKKQMPLLLDVIISHFMQVLFKKMIVVNQVGFQIRGGLWKKGTCRIIKQGIFHHVPVWILLCLVSLWNWSSSFIHCVEFPSAGWGNGNRVESHMKYIVYWGVLMSIKGQWPCWVQNEQGCERSKWEEAFGPDWRHWYVCVGVVLEIWGSFL